MVIAPNNSTSGGTVSHPLPQPQPQPNLQPSTEKSLEMEPTHLDSHVDELPSRTSLKRARLLFLGSSSDKQVQQQQQLHHPHIPRMVVDRSVQREVLLRKMKRHGYKFPPPVSGKEEEDPFHKVKPIDGVSHQILKCLREEAFDLEGLAAKSQRGKTTSSVSLSSLTLTLTSPSSLLRIESGDPKSLGATSTALTTIPTNTSTNTTIPTNTNALVTKSTKKRRSRPNPSLEELGSSVRASDGKGTLIVPRSSTSKSTSNVSSTSLSSGRKAGGILRPETLGETHVPTPEWHAPWKLQSVLSSHLGWVRSVGVDPVHNRLFATGGADRVIKIFDLAKASVGADDALRLTLTGHVGPVRALQFSDRHPYLLSAGEDKQVKCWDLETNQVVRHYHGHLSGVFALKLHPALDVIVTGGRDAVGRVWDLRSKRQVHLLAGHDDAVGSILTDATDPQVVTASYDSTVRLWDLRTARTQTVLTHHKKAVRALCQNPPNLPRLFWSASADATKLWQTADGRFLRNFSALGPSSSSSSTQTSYQNSLAKPQCVWNTLSVNEDGVLVAGADDGTLHFYDATSGYCFQQDATKAQPGSLDAENGIFASAFDTTGTRLITCEADKTIKLWKEDDRADPHTHPLDIPAWRRKCLKEAKQRY